MAAIPVQTVPDAGLADIDFAAAAAADTIADGGVRQGGFDSTTMILLVKNANAATRTVTVGSQPPVVVEATDGEAVIPVFNEGIGDTSVAVVYSATADLTVALLRIGA